MGFGVESVAYPPWLEVSLQGCSPDVLPTPAASAKEADPYSEHLPVISGWLLAWCQ